MKKMYIDIVRYCCPDCQVGTDCIAYLQGETRWTVTIRYICLSMECNHKWTRKYHIPPTKGGIK